MSGAVYLLCAATSCLCAVLLLRGYTQTWVRLLFWSGLCFIGLTIDNVLLYVDDVVVRSIDLGVWRRIPAVLALMVLVFGLVWDSH
jgi:Family of unknown function (DUF5985)